MDKLLSQHLPKIKKASKSFSLYCLIDCMTKSLQSKRIQEEVNREARILELIAMCRA
jgi:hypothetical protein